MAIMEKVFRSLFPPGTPWRLTGNMGDIVDGIALSFDRLEVFLSDLLNEANPGTAEDTLPEWYADLGMKYDATQTLASRRKRARQVYTAIGGQSKGYLEDQIQIAYPDVTLEEVVVSPTFMVGSAMVGLAMVTDYPSWLTSTPSDGSTPGFYYWVTGEVDTVTDLDGLQNILDRIAPLHMEPVYDVTIRQQTDTAQVGLAITGFAEVGKEE